MKKTLILALSAVSAASFGNFFPDDSLVILRANGSSSNAATLDLVGFNFNGSLNGQVFGLSTPSTGNFTGSATAASEGIINGSTYGLAIGGYDRAAGSAVGTAPRRVAIFNNAGAGSVSYVDLAYMTTSTTNRGAFIAADGTTLYTSGSSGGWRVTTDNGATGTQVGSATNVRVVKVHNGEVYGSAAQASPNNGIFKIGTGGTQTSVYTAASGTPSIYDFDFHSEGGNDYILAADDAAGGGLHLIKNGTLVRTFAATSIRNIAVRKWTDTSTNTLKTSIYAISNLNTLIGMTFDQGTIETTTATFSTLFTAASGERLKGIELVPEPASMIAMGVGLVALARRRRK